MCGRYAASKSTDELVEELEVVADHTAEAVRSILKNPQQPPAGQPDFNMAPSKNARVCVERVPRPGSAAGGNADPAEPPGPAEPVRQLRLMTWGLVPGWAKDPSVGARMTNARAETLFEKPAFRKAAATRRLIVPADGWYEWQVSPTATDAKGKPRKQPFYMHRTDGVPVTFAGLYEFWRDDSKAPEDPEAWLASFTVLTRAAEAGLDRIHDRQPVVLEREHWQRWLDPDLVQAEALADLLDPQPSGRFAAYPISRAVSSNRANGPHLLDPAPSDDLDGVLDPVTGEIITARRD